MGAGVAELVAARLPARVAALVLTPVPLPLEGTGLRRRTSGSEEARALNRQPHDLRAGVLLPREPNPAIGKG
jgi:pimeloyl-ACP methyl ester carboxylesterase